MPHYTKPLIVAVLLNITAMSLKAGTVLEDAILHLPPKAVTGIPLGDRSIFLGNLRIDWPKNKRLDLKNDYLEFYTDNSAAEFSDFKIPYNPESPDYIASMFYIKLFRVRGAGYIAFCCIPNPTIKMYVYERDGKEWFDKTKQYLPAQVDAYSEVKPCRSRAVIEFGVTGIDSNPIRKLDLLWNGESFDIRKSPSSKFTDDSL